ncbi:MAG: response regulator [Luteitalea sp.]|nr:response regulator [Luteitalea sp.]
MAALLRDEADIEVVGECASGRQAKTVIDSTAPDLLFLDIQIPEIDGIDLARTIQSSGAPAVVFVTAYDEYAVRAFEVHALDYLLKPFSAELFRSALGHAREHVTKRRAASAGHPTASPNGGPSGSRRHRLVIKSSGRIHFVDMADIDWCEASGNYVRVHAGPQCYLVRDTMSRLESALDPHLFMRIHRSTIVNVDRVQEMHSSFNGEYVVLLRGGTKLTLSRGYRDAIQIRLGKPL